MGNIDDYDRSTVMGLMEKVLVNQDGLCCYGMIHGLPFKIARDYTCHDTPILLNSAFDEDTLLEQKTANVLGVVHPRTKNIIAALQREITVQLFVDSLFHEPDNQIKGITSRNEKSEKSRRQPALQLCANLYGPATLCDSVGAFVAKCSLYLQHPRHCIWNVPYRNPQSLSPEDGGTIFTFDLKAIMHGASLSLEVSTNPIDLFADATVPDALEDTPTPHALSTELYKHQKQALTFMVQRERGWSMDGHHKDLWREEKDSFGQKSYHNIISGLKQMVPPHQFRGGLLIDAPGLGKSLSILALIASSFESRQSRAVIHGGSSTTLIILPKTLVEMWKEEIHKHVRATNASRYCVYYGKDRTKLLEELDKYALVITTYSVVRLDWKTWLHEPENPSTLYATKWGRIVLDEAHIIREPSKSFAKSVCALDAESRWAVSGTPIQNRLLDLFSLFKFLRCAPFDDLRVFNAQVTQKWRARSDPECVAKLKTLVNCLSLRRPKTTIKLLPRKDEIIYLDFDKQEDEDYKMVKARTLSDIQRVESGDRASHGPTFLNALKWVNELRLICNHGRRQSSDALRLEQIVPVWTSLQAQTRFDQLEKVGLAKCSNLACSQDLSSALHNEVSVDHDDESWISEQLEIWCSSCFDRWSSRSSKAHKICNHVPRRAQKSASADSEGYRTNQAEPLTSASEPNSINGSRLPTKVKTLIQSLVKSPDDVKSVVFSSWTQTFDIIKPHLLANSIRSVRLDGSLSSSSRASILRVFRTNPGIKVLLATISCGGVGLDLTAASHAYIMEPQWNPMSESQAFDRIYRLGQTKEVKTIRYIMRGSYEEQVLSLQRRKQELADLTLNNGEISKADLTHGRLQYLKELLG